MVIFDAERLIKMFENLCSRHKGGIFSATLGWEKVKMNHPRYGEIHQLLPLVVIDFK